MAIPWPFLAKKEFIRKYPCQECRSKVLILYEDGKCIDCTHCTSLEYKAKLLKRRKYKPLTEEQRVKARESRRRYSARKKLEREQLKREQA